MPRTLISAAGLPGADDEWVLMLRRHRAAVLSEAARKYGVTPDAVPDYRNTLLPNGKTPADLLTDRAARETVSVKQAQQVMLKFGVITDAGFGAFGLDWQKENRRRETLLSRGEPVYGPKFFPMDEYYFHLHRLRLDAAREALRHNYPVPEDTLSRWYALHREEMPEFRKPDVLTVEIIREKNSGRNEILVLAGEDAHSMQSVYDEVSPLNVGEYSEAFLTPEGGVRYRLAGRKKGDYSPFSEIRPLIERRYYEAALAKEIRRIPAAAVFSG
jgi:hypothetical protein